MAGKYNLPDIVRTDTFEAEQFQIVIDGAALDLTGATIEAVFAKDKKRGQRVKSISVGSGITVTDAANGTFEFDAFDLNWSAGVYYYDIQITKDSVITTYVVGTINVIDNV